MRRTFRLFVLLAGLVPITGRGEGVPLPGEERSSVAPLDAGLGYSVGHWNPGYVLRLGYTFRPTYAVTATYTINKIDHAHGPFDPGYVENDLRLGIQASRYVWKDLEMLASGFQKIRLTNRIPETLGPCEWGTCWVPGEPEWDLDPGAATGLHWGARFWIFPRLSVLVLDGMEWNWEPEEWERSEMAFLLGIHF